MNASQANFPDKAAERRADSELRESDERELRESEERYALAARATREAIWDCDLVTGQVHWNRAIADLFGWDEAVRGSTSEWWRARVHPEERTRVVESIGIATATAQRRRWHAEYRFLRADGQYADVVDRGFIMRDTRGTALRMVGAMLDVTRTKRAEMALRDSEARHRQAAAALEDADRRKDEFLATLAHELRNPLAPLRNALYLLQLQEPSADTKAIHAIMDRQVRQLVRLVDDLLDLSRVTRGKIDLQRRIVELTSVVDTAVEASRPLLDAARHSFTATLPAAPVYVDADPTRLAQVFTNLLNNAAKFT
jgi:PAS domain S-box-containing protein